MGHKWLDGEDDFEAVLVCTTNNLRPWDAEAVNRAFATYQFESYSMPGEDDEILKHVDSGAVVRYDGGMLAIDLGDSLLKEAFPDLILALHALGWSGAEVHHPAATIREFLNDIGRAIPANIDFDIKAAADNENRLSSSPEISHLQSAAHDYLSGATPSLNTAPDNDLSIMFSNALGISETDSSLHVDFGDNNSQIEESFDFPSNMLDEQEVVTEASHTPLPVFDDDFSEPALFNLDSTSDLPPDFVEVPETLMQANIQEEVISTNSVDDFNPMQIVSEYEEPIEEASDLENSASETSYQHQEVSPSVSNWGSFNKKESHTPSPSVDFAKVTHIDAESVLDPGSLTKDTLTTDQMAIVGHSILVFNSISNPINHHDIMSLAEKHGIPTNAVEYIRPGDDNGAYRWDVLGEIPAESPALAATFAQDMVSDFEYGQLVAAAIITAKLSKPNASLRDLYILLCEDNYQNIAQRFPHIHMLQRNYSSHSEHTVKTKFISILSTLLFSTDGSNFIDPNNEVCEAGNIFTIRELAKSDQARMLVFNVDSLDTHFTHWVVGLIKTFASRHAKSKRFSPPPLKKVEPVIKLDISQHDAARLLSLLQQATSLQ